MAAHTQDNSHIHALHTRSPAIDVDPSLVPLFVSSINTAKYFEVAILTVLIYNSLITTAKEAKYFWKPKSPISLVYFANRYVGLLGAICSIVTPSLHVNISRYETDSITRLFLASYPNPTHVIRSCLLTLWIGSLCNLVTVVLIDYILQMRVLALCSQNKKVSICLKILLVAEAGIDLGLLIYSALHYNITVGRLTQGVNVCVATNEVSHASFIISWIVPLVYGTILLCLALFKSTEYWKVSSGFKGFYLVRVLVEDQVLYYGFVIFCCAAQIVRIELEDVSPFVSYLLNAAGSPALLCVLGSHLLINLKEAGEMGVNEGTNYRSRVVSKIEFTKSASNDEDTLCI